MYHSQNDYSTTLWVLCNIDSGYGRNRVEYTADSTKQGDEDILQCNRYTRVKDMLQAVQFISVRQRLYCNVCVLFFKAVNRLLPKEWNDKLQIVGSKSSRVIRQVREIVIKFRWTRSAQKSMYVLRRSRYVQCFVDWSKELWKN